MYQKDRDVARQKTSIKFYLKSLTSKALLAYRIKNNNM